MTFITELKARPEEERVAFAAAAAIAVVVLLATVWAFMFFVRPRVPTVGVGASEQTASVITAFSDVVDKTSDAINAVSGQYKELEGKTKAVGAAGVRGYATSTIEEATQNFMKIRYDEDGNMYIEDADSRSLLNEVLR